MLLGHTQRENGKFIKIFKNSFQTSFMRSNLFIERCLRISAQEMFNAFH